MAKTFRVKIKEITTLLYIVDDVSEQGAKASALQCAEHGLMADEESEVSTYEVVSVEEMTEDE